MPISSFPKECFNDVLSFLDSSTLYNCLFINRYLCRLTVPIIWRDPFNSYGKSRASLISTLLACLNEEELIYRSLIQNNQTPLFEYGKFIKIIRHEYCVDNITNWLKQSKAKVKEKEILKKKKIESRIQKLVNVIYRSIMRQGS